jgi:hypothetical protein
MNYSENFNMTIYANTTIISEMNNISLVNRDFVIIPFTWNISGFTKGNYTIWASAAPVIGEIDLSDNNRTAIYQVKIGVPGDLNNDGKCNLSDLIKVAGKFGKNKGDLAMTPTTT